MPVCYTCAGSGEMMQYEQREVNGEIELHSVMIPCPTCKGGGFVEES